MRALVWLVSSVRRALSFVVLFGMWSLVITPVAWLSRLVRGDVLGRPDPTATTYWEDAGPEWTGDLDDPGLIAFFTRNGKLWLLPVVAVLLGLGVLLVVSESSLVLAFLYPLF